MSLICYAIATMFLLMGVFDNRLEPLWDEHGPELYEPYLLAIFWMLCAIYLKIHNAENKKAMEGNNTLST